MVGSDAKSIEVADIWHLPTVVVWTDIFLVVSLPRLVLLMGCLLVPLMLLERQLHRVSWWGYVERNLDRRRRNTGGRHCNMLLHLLHLLLNLLLSHLHVCRHLRLCR